MKLIFEYTHIYIKELTRNRSAVFFTLFFPAILLQFFGYTGTLTEKSSPLIFIIYCNYAVQTVMLQSLGIAISFSRSHSWNDYLKSLPVNSFYQHAGRIFANLLFAFFSVSIVLIVELLNHSTHLSFINYATIIFCSLIGGIPMALLAIFLGNMVNHVAAKSLFILLNLLFLFCVIITPVIFFQSFLLPYQWFLFSLAVFSHQSFIHSLVFLIFYSLFFCFLIMVEKKFK